MLITGAALALTLKTTIALTTYGTNDVMTWQRDLATLQDRGAAALYRDGVVYRYDSGIVYATQPFIHPPFMLSVLRAWGLFASESGLTLQFWLRFTSSVADLISLLIAARLLGFLRRSKTDPLALVAMALCPASVVISGFHGNTDPVMIAFVLITIYLIEVRRPAWAAGAAMGMALNIKVVPVIFLPAIVLFLPGMRERLRFLGAMAATFAAGSMPYLVANPLLITKTILSYRSKPGLWGFSLFSVLSSQDSGWGWLWRQYQAGGTIVVFAAILSLSIALNLREKKPPLFLQCGAIAFLFLFLTPGFAMQYLAWLVPWVLALGIWPTYFFYAFSGLFVVLVYNHWCGGFPWYLANVLNQRWDVRDAALGLLCWIAVFAILMLYMARLFPWRSRAGNEVSA